MSTISKAIYQIVVLWLHVGVGPMLGAGPMNPRQKRSPRKVVRRVAEGRGDSSGQAIIFADGIAERPNTITEHAHASR
jgi:hypothetical protein